MSEEEINEALKIIKEPITVNSIEYKYFNQKNYEKLLSVYENAKWFVSNWEQALQNINDLQQKVEQLEKELQITANNCKQLENIRKEATEYLTSYESISTIQGLNDIEKNKILDEKTMNEMVNRYLKVHDILLNILNKGDNNGK